MIELHVDDEGQGKLILCGTDISKLVQGATFELEVIRGVPRLRAELDLVLFRDIRLGGDALVGLSDGMVELLKSFGWTPPPEPGSERSREKPE